MWSKSVALNRGYYFELGSYGRKWLVRRETRNWLNNGAAHLCERQGRRVSGLEGRKNQPHSSETIPMAAYDIGSCFKRIPAIAHVAVLLGVMEMNVTRCWSGCGRVISEWGTDGGIAELAHTMELIESNKTNILLPRIQLSEELLFWYFISPPHVVCMGTPSACGSCLLV